MKNILSFLDKIDPYFTQRLILYKSLYVTTVFMYVSWIFHIEVQFTAFLYPTAMLGAIYENPSFGTYKEKKHIFVLNYLAAAVGAFIFYLTFQYKFIFIFVFICYFSMLYFIYDRYIPKLKPFVIITLVICCMNMSFKPSGVMQHAIDIFGLILLSMIVCYLCIITFPNYYHKIWSRAFSLYINAIRNVLISELNGVDNITFIAGTAHMNTMRVYRRLVKKEMFNKVTRSGFYIGNIFPIFCCLDFTEKNKPFWNYANEHLKNMAQSVRAHSEVQLFKFDADYNLDKLEKYFIRNLNASIKNWNKLCNLV